MAKCTLIRGLPGAGKTTYAKKNFSCIILEQDMYFQRDGEYQYSKDKMPEAVNWCKGMAKACLSKNLDVCVVNTFTRKSFIAQYKTLADALGAEFEVLRLNSQYGSVHNVPEQVMKSMAQGFEDWIGEKTVG